MSEDRASEIEGGALAIAEHASPIVHPASTERLLTKAEFQKLRDVPPE